MTETNDIKLTPEQTQVAVELVVDLCSIASVATKLSALIMGRYEFSTEDAKTALRLIREHQSKLQTGIEVLLQAMEDDDGKS